MELFQNRRRKSLIVQATGTGKTRVAISLCKSLRHVSPLKTSWSPPWADR